MRAIKYRRILDGDKKTFAGLEPEFWQAIDQAAQASGVTYRDWCQGQLNERPSGRSMTSWLRVNALITASQ